MPHADTTRERRHVLREFLASALYLAVVLLAVVVAAIARVRGRSWP